MSTSSRKRKADDGGGVGDADETRGPLAKKSRGGKAVGKVVLTLSRKGKEPARSGTYEDDDEDGDFDLDDEDDEDYDDDDDDDDDGDDDDDEDEDSQSDLSHNEEYLARVRTLPLPKNRGVEYNLEELEEGLEGIHNDVVNLADADLKVDAKKRPLWVDKKGHIYLETFSPLYHLAYDFLIAISEPVCRPKLIHEYHITTWSIYAAVSVGIGTNSIIETLEKLSKVALPREVEKFIRDSSQNYGLVKIVIRNSEFALESANLTILEALLKDPDIADARRQSEESAAAAIVKTTSVGKGALRQRKVTQTSSTSRVEQAQAQAAADAAAEAARKAAADLGLYMDDDGDVAATESEAMFSFSIDAAHIRRVKKRCAELNYPPLEEYDFRDDKVNKDIEIDLKPTTLIRPFQEKSLNKMFGNGRARSGIIVLPCGAGKTLTGITACCTVRKSCLVLCTSNVAVEQWKRQFLLWTDVKEEVVVRFTADNKEIPNGECIMISTYSMFAYRQKRSAAAAQVMRVIEDKEWGLLIMDEVHVAPAETFQYVCATTKAHCRLGLTATLVREDGRIGDLNFLIGPKLYEANWMDLQRGGYIAKVQCAEVWCDMTPEFYKAYLEDSTTRQQNLLYVMNPNKFLACQFLINYHEARGDKILVFSDIIYSLKYYAKVLHRPYISGEVEDHERMKILKMFQFDSDVNCVFLSTVGDTSFDLPEATVLIQISSQFGSRRQEAQRLGRILRAKPGAKPGEFNAFFYSLVSKDTQEMLFATKREQFLVDQGYAFKVVTQLPIDLNDPKIVGKTKEEQADVLNRVLSGEAAIVDEDREIRARRRANVNARTGSLHSIAQRTNGPLGRAPTSNLFKNFRKQREKRAKWEAQQQAKAAAAAAAAAAAKK